MLFVIALLAAVSVSLLVMALAELVPSQPRAITRQLVELQQRRLQVPRREAARLSPRHQLTDLLTRIGKSLAGRRGRQQSARDLLVRAGYRSAESISVFWGARLAAAAAMALVGIALMGLSGKPVGAALLIGLWLGTLGWLAPPTVLKARARRRQREMIANLPDALDLMVVCVEAGLGLNLAITRMADEIRHFSRVTAEEFTLVNLEIRAGVPREEALRNLGERTGLDDLRALGAMLIQTDRFGTSIAQALRVHSDTLRSKRRQTIEELAAKTTIKLIFPLVLCIFPALFVVVLGPALIGLFRALSQM